MSPATILISPRIKISIAPTIKNTMPKVALRGLEDGCVFGCCRNSVLLIAGERWRRYKVSPKSTIALNERIWIFIVVPSKNLIGLALSITNEVAKCFVIVYALPHRLNCLK